MKQFRGYFASHFFNAGMYDWTERVADALIEATGVDFYLPQRNDSINDKKSNDDTITDIAISKADTLQLKKAHILVACLDGLTIDDGVAGEIMAHGIMAELEEEYGVNPGFPRMILGVLTDMRHAGTGENHLYRNQMIIGKIKEHGHMVYGYPGDDSYIGELIDHINNFIKAHSNTSDISQQ